MATEGDQLLAKAEKKLGSGGGWFSSSSSKYEGEFLVQRVGRVSEVAKKTRCVVVFEGRKKAMLVSIDADCVQRNNGIRGRCVLKKWAKNVRGKQGNQRFKGQEMGMRGHGFLLAMLKPDQGKAPQMSSASCPKRGGRLFKVGFVQTHNKMSRQAGSSVLEDFRWLPLTSAGKKAWCFFFFARGENPRG